MKREKLSAGIQGAVLAFLLTLGAMGAMATGLRLNVENLRRLAVLWAAVCIAAAVLSSVRFGGWVLLAGAAWSVLYVLRNEDCRAQTLEMLCRITKYYDNAYGWGFLRSPEMGSGPMDLPLGVLGGWIALVNCRSLVRGKSGILPLLLAAVPLIACVVVTDTVPDSLYLYLWLLGLVPVLLSRGLRREQTRWGVNVVRMAAIPTALALGLLFWAVPREGYDKHPEELSRKLEEWVQSLPDKWNEVTDEVASAVDGTIQPETIRLDTLGPRLKRVYPVMDVTAPVSGTVYLRGRHYDTYTGSGWTASESRELFRCPEDSRELGRIIITTRALREVVYLPYYPDENLNLYDGCIENTAREKQDAYTMRGLDSQWRNLVEERSSQSVPMLQREDAQRVNLELPQKTHTWALGVVDTILNGETTATAVADAIAGYVRSSALYDLDTPKMTREYDDFVRWFLEESDTGYCVHFATAATVLLRAAGVEARYVEGYMFTAQMGEETTVTADQAHAWVEYYEPLLDAWIVLEATPPDLSGAPQTEAEETEPSRPVQTEETSPSGTETEPEIPAQQESTNPREEPGEKQEQAPDLSRLWAALRWVLAPIPAALAAEGQRQLRLRRRENLRRRGSPNRQALARWRELEKLHRLLKTEPPAFARDTALKAKYSPHPISREELAALEKARREALGEMNKRPWYIKFIDRYIFSVI